MRDQEASIRHLMRAAWNSHHAQLTAAIIALFVVFLYLRRAGEGA